MKKIDLRSDTVTLPSEEMMDAIQQAKLGDDVYGEDPTVNELQEKAAKMLGKEAALLVCSGTMGNICGVVGQTNKGDEVILEENAHIVLHEVASAAVIGGVQIRTLTGENGYLITPDMLDKAVRGFDVHYPISKLVCIENTHNMAGGKYWTPKQVNALTNTAKKHNLKVHVDGARIFNAAIAQQISTSELLKNTDSVMFCLSKGLACPIGSIIAGSSEFIESALRVRKMLGGGMRQAGIIAAPGIVALDSMIDRLAEDHENAKRLKLGLSDIPGIKTQDCQTNMLFIDITGLNIGGIKFKNELAKHNIIVSSRWDTTFRLVTHYGIEKEDIDFVIETIHTLFGK
ncbi:MAG: aminotransferase class I/II-fold pyridoxal phosphate-dependent enzyme [Asgard group archaeon]|nr:aminotransferase class I/II-fold pyridoxal phosphate-dependent enzyme [Asgard group archaeon]